MLIDFGNSIDSLINPAYFCEVNCNFIYRTRAIISRGLYIFYPISKDHFFDFKEVFSENSVPMYGLYSRADSNQARLMMARARYCSYDSCAEIKLFVSPALKLKIRSDITFE